MRNERQYGVFSSPYSALGDDFDSQMAKSWAFDGNPTTLHETPSIYNDKSKESPRPLSTSSQKHLTIPRSFTLLALSEKPKESVAPTPLVTAQPARHEFYAAVGDD